MKTPNISIKIEEEITQLLNAGYRCRLWGYRIHLCSGDKCIHKDRCIFMYGKPEHYDKHLNPIFV